MSKKEKELYIKIVDELYDLSDFGLDLVLHYILMLKSYDNDFYD